MERVRRFGGGGGGGGGDMWKKREKLFSMRKGEKRGGGIKYLFVM